jgi:hypothetical protein
MENTTQIPDALPILSSGHHPAGSGKACVMDAISWLQGKPEEGDAPSCVHPVLRSLAIKVNDNMADVDRWQLWGLVPRLIGTADLRDDVVQRRVLNVRLAIFSARSVLHLSKNQPVSLAAIRSAEVWCDDEPTEGNRLRAKAAYASAASAADAADAAAAAAAAYASAASAADAADAAAAAASASAYAASDAAYAASASAYADAASASAYAASASAYAASASADATDAASASAYAASASAYAASASAYATDAASAYAASASASAYATDAASAYAASASASATDAGLGLLTGLIGEHERLTGHQPTPVVESEWAKLTGMLGSVPAGSTP